MKLQLLKFNAYINLHLMRGKKLILLLFFAFNILAVFTVKAQTNKLRGIQDIVTNIRAEQLRVPSEKLHIVTDKPYYLAGDTIWFKVYLLNASNRLPSVLSSKVYVDLLNDSSRIVERLVIPLQNGMGEGDIKLSAPNLGNGGYTLRGYTNWMKNFGEDAFFHKQFYIGGESKNNWLISEQHTVKNTANGKAITLAIALNDVKNGPVLYKDVQLLLLKSNKVLFKKTFTTADQGTFETSMSLPAEADTRHLKLALQYGPDKKSRQTFPFYPGGNAQEIDIQFMPEGGEMVAGLLNKIAFKAIAEDGMGTAIAGTIVDSKGREVAAFRSGHNGMGNFRMVPLANEIYQAKVPVSDGIKTAVLPAVKTQGTALRIDNISKADTVSIYISATATLAATNKSFSLLAQAKDSVYFGLSFNVTNGFYNISIPKNKFATGIVNFTLLDEAGNALNERRIFINRHDGLRVNALTEKLLYQPKDSITVAVTVLNADGTPAKNSNFVAAVTDDTQVKNGKYGNSFLSQMLLTSELKGTIEGPGWYFSAENSAAEKALDDLLLTQGWTGITDYKLLYKTPEPTFLPETGNILSGNLRKFFNKPAADEKVTLLLQNKETAMIMDTVSNKDGRFIFDNIPYLDSVVYTIKVNNKKGSTFGGGVNIDEITPAGPMPLYQTAPMPWFVNTDETLLKYYENNAANKQAVEKVNPDDIKGTLLNQVNIKGKRATNLRGEDGLEINFYDALIDEKQLLKAGRLSLYDYLNANVKHFKTITGYRGNPNDNFIMNGNVIFWIIIDGINVKRFYMMSNTPNNHYNFLKSYLTGLRAADVKEMVIYHDYNDQLKDFLGYLVIKTRGGNGPTTGSPAGIYVYRPAPLYQPRQFYKPRYAVNNKYDEQIKRSTIHWEPNLITDENGKATLSFYAADKPSTYTVNIEGTDMFGHFGNHTIKIKVDNKPVN